MVGEKFEARGAIGNFIIRKRGTVTIAGKPSVDVPPGTLNSVLKQAGLKKAD
jgi:predicted RNA binding protein YcfA (HicA-like mRNA interferase family)